MGIALLLSTLVVGAVTPPTQDMIRIERAMVDAEPAPTKESASGGYARLTSVGRDDKLIAVSCTCAREVDLHRIVREPKPDMLVKQALDLPANKAVDVRPGSDWHFWVGDMVHPMIDGQTVKLVLTFEKAGAIEVPFAVRASTKDAWAAFEKSP